MNDSDRIGVLRVRCLERKNLAWKDISSPRAKALRESEHVSSWQERQGLCTREVLSSMVFDIDDLELLAGRLAPRPDCITDQVLADATAVLKEYPPAWGMRGHCVLNVDDVLKMGIDGLCQDIESRMGGADPEKAGTYRSFLCALSGLSTMIENAGAVAVSRTEQASDARLAELRRIAEACEWIAHKPPRSFYEAVQLLWMVNLGVQHGETVWLTGPGHLDRTIRGFYESDIAAGIITESEVLLILESLYLLINEYTTDGLAIPVMVGGRDETGKDVTNPLSYLCLEALRRTKLVYPTVGVCWNEDTPSELTELAIELICKGYTTPAFFGDDVIQRGLSGFGVPPEEACNYINSACVEITPVGGSNVWVASPYYNLCGILLEEIADSAEGDLPSFEDFKTSYFERVARAVDRGVEQQNRFRLQREQRGRKPLQSVFTRDCIERGRDIDCGGAKYNWVECSFVGLANLADSLYVLREEVFESKRLSVGELRDILDSDFDGFESVRQRFFNAYPKYGQDDPRVDAFVQETAQFLVELCAGYRMRPDDSPYVPGAFVWTMHEQLGRETGATPDGRKTGMPFADGAGPAQGRESRGPTAAILSTTSWDHSPFMGGVAFNMKFSASLFDRSHDARNALCQAVLAFLKRGGLETQINVVDRECLKRAQKTPAEYRDLVVRIGGYTDYFTRLSIEMQNEIIQRTEYGHV